MSGLLRILSVMEIKAHIVDEFRVWNPDHTVRLVLYRQWGQVTEAVMSDGTWYRAPAGEQFPGEVGLVIPREALVPIHAEIERVQGTSLHTSTESKVLREWLEAERARVDRLIFPTMEDV